MIEIKNLRNEKPTEPWDFRVDRQTPLGNPFKMIIEKDRDAVCNLYIDHFNNDWMSEAAKEYLKTLVEAYKTYGKLNLFCWCYPKRCHAETIRNYILKEGGKWKAK